MPDAQLIVVVPNVGDKVEVLYGSIRLAMRQGDNKIEAFSAGGRSGFMFIPPEGGGGPPFPVHAAWWLEGKHFVFYFGTRKTETIIDEMKANATKGGLTNNPLYQRAQKLGNFESVTRGFVNTGSLVGMAKTLAGPFVPGLRERLDNVGLSSIKALVFTSGFDGKESRAIYEFDAPGERQGFAKALKNKPLTLDDLPPMPPDVSRFSALRLDPETTYDATLSLIDFLNMNDNRDDFDPKKSPAEQIKERKESMKRDIDKFLGISVQDDLMPHLGDKLVVFQSPLEGLSVFGTVVCISCKDPAKVKAATDRVQRALEAIANSPIKVRKKMVKGVEVREFSSRGFGVLTPSYAVVGDWLVIAGYPQAVNGLILRTKGDLEKWKPDAETTKRLAKMPANACGIQYCNAKSSAQNLCCVGPLFFAQLEQQFRFRETGEADFDPLDAGLIPNAHEISKHLFPNLTFTHDDGKTIRIEVNESFSVPLEFIGVEPLIVFGAIFGLRF
jgi:hypothetical protein